MSAANDLLAQHIIERMLADVEVLEQVGALETDSASTIRSQLHPLLSDEGSAVASTATAVSALRISAAAQKREAPPPPTSASSAPKDLAKALWAYPGEDSDELSFGVNDTIVVTERTSSDWWKGHVQGSPAVVGLFPSNYVEVIASSPAPARAVPPAYRASVSSSSSAVASSEKSSSSAQASNGERLSTIGPPKWKPGVSRWSSGAAQPERAVSPYSTPAGPSAPPPPVNPNAPTPEDPAIAQAKRDRFKGIGNKVGDSAVRGFGFGLGAGMAGKIL
ncbi:SH3-domain-containing protein [Ceraceosorus guamensis]|uniref:SH3-domain-containing protein n=1 Tax=Ceraceosorus guamensis TaxID=1522189 RepID=A0A316VWR3_9BASI|nr:SH3-domain-containing protein [Ceraceosorus guamensis]PWN41744.1 SH3-domain-containing protein [Ceraceosorus guamensis]